MMYAFILGRKNLLSTAELCNVFTDKDHIVDIQRESLIADLKEDLQNPQNEINKLGGTVKISRVFAELPPGEEDLITPILNHLLKKFADSEHKIIYGVSAYNIAQRHEKIIKRVLINLKKGLKKDGRKCRFINKGFSNLKNAAIAGENLLKKGVEVLIIEGEHKTYLAETVALQDIENYSKRDYNRPHRDPKLGMLPPKLAQIMINLAGLTRFNQTPKETIFDPFAGIGTLLSEAILMGYNAIGSDIKKDVLDKAQINADWLQTEFQPPGKILNIFQKDATTLKKQDLPNPAHAIITESYLGPPLTKIPTDDQIKKTFGHIEELTTRFFRALEHFIPAKTPIVISFPAYKLPQKTLSIEDLAHKITLRGFTVAPLIPNAIKTRHEIHCEDALIYDRTQQLVARQIYKFTKN